VPRDGYDASFVARYGILFETSRGPPVDIRWAAACCAVLCCAVLRRVNGAGRSESAPSHPANSSQPITLNPTHHNLHCRPGTFEHDPATGRLHRSQVVPLGKSRAARIREAAQVRGLGWAGLGWAGLRWAGLGWAYLHDVKPRS